MEKSTKQKLELLEKEIEVLKLQVELLKLQKAPYSYYPYVPYTPPQPIYVGPYETISSDGTTNEFKVADTTNN